MAGFRQNEVKTVVMHTQYEAESLICFAICKTQINLRNIQTNCRTQALIPQKLREREGNGAPELVTNSMKIHIVLHAERTLLVLERLGNAVCCRRHT